MAYKRRKKTTSKRAEMAKAYDEKNREWLQNFLLEFPKKEHKLWWDNGFIGKARRRECGIGASGPYRNGNALLTGMYMLFFKYDSRQFRTKDQITKMGGHIKEGHEDEFVIIEWPIFKWCDKDNKIIKEQRKYTAEEAKALGIHEQFITSKLWQVYNLSITDLEYEPDYDFSKEEKAKKPKGWYSKACKKAKAIKAKFFKKKGNPVLEEVEYTDTPCYMPLLDKIKIPVAELFKTVAFYFSSLFHEMVHSTGHSTRLNRLTSTSMKTKGYALEELVAEIGSSMVMADCGFDTEDYLENNAVYIEHWLQRASEIENFDKVLLASFKKANDAVDMIEGEIV